MQDKNIRNQLVLSEKQTDCKKFGYKIFQRKKIKKKKFNYINIVPNSFVKSKCAECGFILHVHASEAIDDEHIMVKFLFITRTSLTKQN